MANFTPNLLTPVVSGNFSITIEGIGEIWAKSITMPQSTSQIFEYREGHEPDLVRYISGRVTFGTMTIEKAVIYDHLNDGLYQWRNLVETSGSESPGIKRNVTINLYTMSSNKNLIRTYILYNCWPSSLIYSNINAMSPEIFLQSLTIVFEDMDVTAPTFTN